jgi:hypothetical protein
VSALRVELRNRIADYEKALDLHPEHLAARERRDSCVQEAEGGK